MSRHIDKKQSNIEIEKLIDLYGDALLRLCYLYLHDWQLAEDAVQDVYINIFRKYNKFIIGKKCLHKKHPKFT